MTKKTCEKCGRSIDLKKEKYVLLGTYAGVKTIEELYFHWQCWRLHFEEKARQKAQAVVKGMQERMIPIAKELVGRMVG